MGRREAPSGALDGSGSQRRDARRAVAASQADLHEQRAGSDECAGVAFDSHFVGGITKRGGHRPRALDGRVDVAQHVQGYRPERSRMRILGIDDIGATCKRGQGLRGARHAHQQLHRCSLVPKVFGRCSRRATRIASAGSACRRIHPS
jgi:hypothetical protein